MSAPRIFDVFGGAGGSAVGLQQAGFEVVVVDSDPKLAKSCPVEFVRMDAFEFIAEHGHEFDAGYAGPPCQGYSTTKSLHANEYPRWIGAVRIMLKSLGQPYAIENVVGARAAMRDPLMLCGSSFGLGVRRHRLFETSFPVGFVPPCAHYLQPEPVDVTGTGGSRIGPRLDGKGGNSRKPRNLAHAREVMGIDWMSRTQLAEAIPPPFATFIGHADDRPPRERRRMTRRPLTDAQLDARINEIEAARAGQYLPPLYAGRPPVCLVKRRPIDRPGMHPTRSQS